MPMHLALLGVPFLALAKAAYLVRGYATPKPFTDRDACVAHSRRIAESYLSETDVRRRHVLELGPGSDLGVGISLLHAGAATYTAVDRNSLAGNADEFHRHYARSIGATEALVDQLHYVVRPGFRFDDVRPPAPGAVQFDIVFSNAAFEHFDDVASTLRQVERVLAPGGWLIAVVDLKTHTRWIRERDPNNVYRFPSWLYRTFAFPGQPNRVRPREYREALAHWRRVETVPLRTMQPVGSFAAPFDSSEAEMDVLEFRVRAQTRR